MKPQDIAVANEMTRDHLARALAAITHTLDTRVHIWRIVVDEHGRETGQRIYRGSFQQPRDLQNSGPHSRGE